MGGKFLPPIWFYAPCLSFSLEFGFLPALLFLSLKVTSLCSRASRLSRISGLGVFTCPCLLCLLSLFLAFFITSTFFKRIKKARQHPPGPLKEELFNIYPCSIKRNGPLAAARFSLYCSPFRGPGGITSPLRTQRQLHRHRHDRLAVAVRCPEHHLPADRCRCAGWLPAMQHSALPCLYQHHPYSQRL